MSLLNKHLSNEALGGRLGIDCVSDPCEAVAGLGYLVMLKGKHSTMGREMYGF